MTLTEKEQSYGRICDLFNIQMRLLYKQIFSIECFQCASLTLRRFFFGEHQIIRKMMLKIQMKSLYWFSAIFNGLTKISPKN